MINSDLMQTLVIDRTVKKLSAEIYFGDLQKLQKTLFFNVFDVILPKIAYANWKL